MDSTTTLEELKTTVLEDYGIESSVIAEFSYFPTGLINKTGSPRVVIANDRQVHNYVAYVRKQESRHLCVAFTYPVQNQNGGENGALNDEPSSGDYDGNFHEEFVTTADGDNGAPTVNKGEYDNDKTVRFALTEVMNKKEFITKLQLKATFEICAMKHNFDYKVIKSNTRVWSIRCSEKACKWGVYAKNLKGSTCFIIKKYVAEHTCAASSKTKVGRTASAKTIGNLILQQYEGVKEGPKPNDIIKTMRMDHGCEISYSLAWESREYAVNMVRGIPEKSYAKIPKYLHMLRAANPGTHTSYKLDSDGSFRYLFIAFGQSIRGFYKAIRRVIVVDGTFLKNKYKGTLLVATALDGNFNLYPIAFGVVDSENDLSWEWFFRELSVVIADDYCLAFVSDRHLSIGKALDIVYPRAAQGICIHHLLSNVVKSYHGKNLVGLVAKASKAYRITDFQKMMTDICKISPSVGKYLIEADVRKWARCRFVGYRYDIRTTNPAESINAALRSPREYPVIPLLDSIREMLTRWFYERRNLSSKHNHPLTKDAEKKIDRRIEKGKKFQVYPVDQNKFVVPGDKFDCLVDLARRTCTCGKYDLLKMPCKHAVKAILHLGKEPHAYSDEKFTADLWRTSYEEPVNPILEPEDTWRVPQDVEQVQVSPPESRRAAGRRRKRRFETVEDKIRSSQGPKKRHKCSRCGKEGHNRATCDFPI
uniref:SWIM-type domain-containing protein n=2 Tax=Noccaea caerulescens TaxID=107243 RepID=A0A1J3EYW1_NOCCA